MPGIALTIAALDTLRKEYQKFDTDEERRKWLWSRLAGFFEEPKHCIIYIIDYLKTCYNKIATEKDLLYYLADKTSGIEKAIQDLKTTGHLKENSSGGLIIVR